MKRHIYLWAAMLVGSAGFSHPSQAEEVRLALPAGTKFVVQADLPAIQKSKVGGRLFAALKAEVLGKMEDKGGDKDLSLDKIVEILGFDPFEEVQCVMVAAADYESPEQSLVGCVQLRSTTGNLEGLLLALPGYGVDDEDGRQIHSAKPEDMPVYGAFHEQEGGGHTVVVAAQRESLVAVLDALDGDAGSDDSSRAVTLGQDDGPLATVDVFELPAELTESDGPEANVAKIVRSVSVRLTESDDKVHIAASIVAAADKQAEQLEQAARGLGAMISLAASGDADDEDLQMVQKLLTGLRVERDGATLQLNLSVPAEQVISLIDENLLDK